MCQVCLIERSKALGSPYFSVGGGGGGGEGEEEVSSFSNQTGQDFRLYSASPGVLLSRSAQEMKCFLLLLLFHLRQRAVRGLAAA